LGAHLVTPRFGFAHHGIYVGGGNVVHYGALASLLGREPVEEVSLDCFAEGQPLFVRPHAAPRFDCDEAIRRARSRLGEDRYSLLRNNCEHFCEWCLQDEHRSRQVERALTLPRTVVARVSAALSRILATQPPPVERSLRVLPIYPPDSST
jgi:hypothetical protein